MPSSLVLIQCKCCDLRQRGWWAELGKPTLVAGLGRARLPALAGICDELDDSATRASRDQASAPRRTRPVRGSRGPQPRGLPM